LKPVSVYSDSLEDNASFFSAASRLFFFIKVEEGDLTSPFQLITSSFPFPRLWRASPPPSNRVSSASVLDLHSPHEIFFSIFCDFRPPTHREPCQNRFFVKTFFLRCILIKRNTRPLFFRPSQLWGFGYEVSRVGLRPPLCHNQYLLRAPLNSFSNPMGRRDGELPSQALCTFQYPNMEVKDLLALGLLISFSVSWSTGSPFYWTFVNVKISLFFFSPLLFV